VLLKQFGAISFNNWLEHPSIGTWGYVLLALLFAAIGLAVANGTFKPTKARKAAFAGVGALAGLLLALLLGLFLEGRSFSRWVATVGSESTPLPEQLFPSRIWDYVGHTILPMITLAVISFAVFSRYQRASMLETMNSDYVRTAKAKGISNKRVIMKHGFRTALIPVTTIIAISFAGVLAGAFITENIFAWKGMGTLFRNSLLPYPDPNPAMAYLMITAMLVVVGNIVADIAYAYLDPRIRLD
jgi:peptide/nickel transport system permease protein